MSKIKKMDSLYVNSLKDYNKLSAKTVKSVSSKH